MNNAQAAGILESLLVLKSHPVAVSFLSKAPPDIARVRAPGPASCAYWKMAGDGATFYTEAGDHLNCPIGAHTHGVPIPPEKVAELQSIVGQMIGIGYISGDEVPGIPARTAPFQVAVYSPLGQSPVAPDVVIVSGEARQIMLLAEAAQAAGLAPQSRLMMRPTCAFIPEAIATGRGISSFACIGNRVYTGLADNDLYFAVPGPKICDVSEALEKIVAANAALEKFHEARRAVA